MCFSPRTSWAFLVVGLSACNGAGDDVEDCDPVAIAGPDQHVALPGAVTLDGTASTGCAAELAHTWTFEQVPVGSGLDDAVFGVDNGTASAATLDFVPDVIGSYVVTLTVNDGVATSNPDLLVIDVSAGDARPVAHAGEDGHGGVGERVILDGSGSSDPDGDELTYLWSLATAPDGSGVDSGDVFDPHSIGASFVPDVAGTYVLSLEVFDAHQWSDPDYVTIAVASDNTRPVADAGEPRTVPPCDEPSFQLNGHGSHDLDGDALTHEWSVTAVPTGSEASDAWFDDRLRADPWFSWDVPGEYTFQLQVFDGELQSANDIVTITTVDETTNGAPVASAGLDQAIAVKVDCVYVGTAWTCGDCDPARIELDGTGSVDPDGDTLTYAWTNAGSPTASGELTVGNTTSAWTEAWSPPVSGTFGVAKKHVFDVDLAAADCALSGTDRMRITVSCTGVKP